MGETKTQKISTWLKFKNLIKKLSCKFSCCNSDCKLDKNQLTIEIDDLRIQLGEMTEELKIVKKNSINQNAIISEI
tara:strand:- start:3159 stop:3386 length:228 start_codon:yes stop_codon:yes gene_type:complete